MIGTILAVTTTDNRVCQQAGGSKVADSEYFAENAPIEWECKRGGCGGAQTGTETMIVISWA